MLAKVRNFFSGNNEIFRDKFLGTVLRELDAGQLILDVGSGECRNKKFCSHLQYISVDRCEYEGIGNATGLQTGRWETGNVSVVGDGQELPFKSNSFDIVLCTEVLEHTPYPTEMLKELGRVCKSGGLLVLTAPFASVPHFTPYFYVSGFSEDWYRHHIPLVGCELVKLEPNGDFFKWLLQEFLRACRLVARQKIFTRAALFGVFLLYAIIYRLSLVRTPSTEMGCFGFHCIAKKQ